MDFERRSNQVVGCTREIRLEPGCGVPEISRENFVLFVAFVVSLKKWFFAPRRTRSMNIERRSHQAAGCTAEVQMEPDRGMPRTTSKNLRVLRALRGVTPEMIFLHDVQIRLLGVPARFAWNPAVACRKQNRKNFVFFVTFVAFAVACSCGVLMPFNHTTIRN